MNLLLLSILSIYFSLCAGVALPATARGVQPRWWLFDSPGFNLINGTPWTWRLNSTAAGKLPKTVEPFSVFSTDRCGNRGTATYVLDKTNAFFQIDLATKQVKLTGMSTLGNQKGSTIQLGREDADDGYVNFVLAGNDTQSLISTNPPKNWMQTVLPVFGNTPLGRFILPGSHDAGMAYLDLRTIAAKSCNTLTQSQPIKHQLETGARYFDIRPVISAGMFKTGHYSDLKVSSQGGNGESLDRVINEVNEFTKDKAEVIVIRLSHDLNTDVGNSQYRPFNEGELQRFYTKLKGINDLFVASSPDVDLTTLTLNQLTSNGSRSAVILQFRLDGDFDLGALKGQGFFTYEQLNTYNEFSNDNDIEDMMSDQLAKMKEQRIANPSQPFMLSWTLTQSAFNTVSCPLISSSIIEMAATARKALYTDVLSAVTGPNTYPQFIQIDDFSAATDIVPLALAMVYKAQAIQ